MRFINTPKSKARNHVPLISVKVLPESGDGGQDSLDSFLRVQYTPPCILKLVWDNQFTKGDQGAADRNLLGHGRPDISEGRRTHSE